MYGLSMPEISSGYPAAVPDESIPLFVGKSPRLASVFQRARMISKSNSSVLITGESGTGKDVLARSIHQMSERSKNPFVAINCSAIPDELLESELFGHIKGAFTGAVDRKTGLFEEACGGTLFLDEIGDLNYKLQSKLLRVVQERKIRRIGETSEIKIDVRIICATHKNIPLLIQENKFREDLYYRLNVISLHIPPLRERKDDIAILSKRFIGKHAQREQKASPAISAHAIKYLENLQWPGNVRELENTIERAVILCQGSTIEEADLLQDPGQNAQSSVQFTEPVEDNPIRPYFSINEQMTLEQICNTYVMFTLQQNKFSREKTYRDLNIDRKTLYRRILATSKTSEVFPSQHNIKSN
jgi:two-component system response regulator HydG